MKSSMYQDSLDFKNSRVIFMNLLNQTKKFSKSFIVYCLQHHIVHNMKFLAIPTDGQIQYIYIPPLPILHGYSDSAFYLSNSMFYKLES